MTDFDINTLQLSTSQHLFKGELAIERTETHDIVHWILSTIPAREDHKICLLTGTAGQGKTVVLQNLLKEMEKYEKFPVFALKADLVDFENISPNEFVKQYGDEFKRLSDCDLWPVLVIDQIDALSKTLSTDRKPINLLDKLIGAVCKAKNACVIISCRPYDLDFDPVLSKYKYKKKIALGNLRTEQVNDVLREFCMGEYSEGSKMMQFLSVPLHLELFLEYGKVGQETVTLQSLFDTLWRKKITEVAEKSVNVSTASLTACLESLTDILNNSSSLGCSRKKIEDHFAKEIDYLISENVLVSHANIDTISFVHQALGDYVSSRLLAQSGQKMADILEGEHQGLYIRNRVKQYFTYIREADEDQYIREVEKIICDKQGKYRTHIKMLILTTMASWENPTEAEKYFVSRHVIPDKTYLGMFAEAITKRGWFEVMSQHPSVVQGLKKKDKDISQMMKHVCENVMLYDSKAAAAFLLSQVRDGDTEWNRQWMEVAERYSSPAIIKQLLPLYEQLRDDRSLQYDNFLQQLASVDYDYVERMVLEYVRTEIEKQMEDKDEDSFLFRVNYLDNDANNLLEHLFETYQKRGAETYLKVIRQIDDASKYEPNGDAFGHQESRAYLSFSSSSYYNHCDRLVADYLEYARKAVAADANQMKAIVQETLSDKRSIIYYIGLCICRMSPQTFVKESTEVLTNKNLLEELDSKTSYQLTKLLEVVFPLLSEAVQSNVMDIIATVAPKWEKTPIPDLRKYHVPLYHIGRRKQELLTSIPEDYLRQHRPEEWQFLQQMNRELNKAEIHEPYKMHTKSGWGAHSLDTMKAMKKADMLRAFRKYDSNVPGFDEHPTRQGECMNFQNLVTENPKKYVDLIEEIIGDRSIHSEYAAYGIIGLMKSKFDVKTAARLTDCLIAVLMDNLTAQENYYTLMDILREMDYFIVENAVSPMMMEFMCRIVKEYPEEHYKDDNLEKRHDVYNTGINRARGNAAFHLVKCDGMSQYKDQIFDALESCVDASPATKGAIILQQALLNNLDIQRNFQLYMNLVKDKTPSLVSIPLNNLHPLIYFINTNFEDLKTFFKDLYEVEESHDVLSQILWIAWVRGREEAELLLEGLLKQSDKAKESIITYFTKDIVANYFEFVKPVVEWCADSKNEEVGKVFDYLINDIEELDWEDVRWYIDVYVKSNVFAYAGNQFLEFMKDNAATYPEDVLRWMCAFANVENKNDSHPFMASRTLSNIVSAYNAIRKYDKRNKLLEDALDTMDRLMSQQQVRRGMLHFLYELDNN